MSEERSIQHYCHTEHKLKAVYSKSNFECQVCKYEGEGMRYQCNPCEFEVHAICGMLPGSLSSSAHPEHELYLSPKPHLIHKCGLCRSTIKGMVYRCEAQDCKFFLHPTCSLAPELCRDHPDHPSHPLTLRDLDYKEECKICEKKCKHWRYHCKNCGVHMHVECLLSTLYDADAAGGAQTSTGNHRRSGRSSKRSHIGVLADVVQIAQGAKEIIGAVASTL